MGAGGTGEACEGPHLSEEIQLEKSEKYVCQDLKKYTFKHLLFLTNNQLLFTEAFLQTGQGNKAFLIISHGLLLLPLQTFILLPYQTIF